ncbi:hypothetical protein AAW51_0453 [Caldimonas brevitalea]|uniref:DUF2946 domain-containing protein n=1 Tax=Caldimonas brevitalea TaxID=413882 RepID=A0A0G3BCP5_9BURK|nr:hypothetical protein AAW51_0453 [Caldimonas brevitalea]
MWRVVRSVLLWVLAVALPFQGAVAATMIACGPQHHGTALVFSQATAADPHDAADGHVEHGHSQQHLHGPTADTRAAPDAPQLASADAHPDADPHQATASKCSVCAFCCAPAALPVSATAIDPPPAVDSLHPTSESHAVVFMTDGPERPPRTFLA